MKDIQEKERGLELVALHGFLGEANDWISLFQGSRFEKCLRAVDLFKTPIANSMEIWAQEFNSKSAITSNQKALRVLMGYSLGGRLALHALSHNQKQWDAAIIISANPGLSLDEDKQKRLIVDNIWTDRFENEDWEKVLQSWNSQPVFQNDSFHFSRKESDDQRTILAEVLRNWSLGTQENLLPVVNKLELPILWMAGENDSSYSSLMKDLSLQHSLSAACLVDKVGHRVPWQDPESFLLKISEFIDAVYFSLTACKR